MAKFPDDRVYTEDHEWVMLDEDNASVVIIGITDYAQGELGDIVMVELPEVGDELGDHDVLGAVESPKSVSDVYTPLAGEVVAVNDALEDAPELINEDCYDKGWIVKIKVTNPGDLDDMLDAAAYKEHVEGLE